MNTITNNHSQDRGEQVSVNKVKIIKLGIDVHFNNYRVVRQLDEATPQPAQRFTSMDFLAWVKKQLVLAGKVYACYESGPLGYVLYRQLIALGVECFVVRAQDWDEWGKRVKTDKRDALALCQRLDRYVVGNKHALAIVRVPSEEEEQLRSVSRQRDQLVKERKRMQMQGRSLLLSHGIAIRGTWWKGRAWNQLCPKVKPWLIEHLETWRPMLISLEETIQKMTRQLEESCSEAQPRGFGSLSYEVLRREIGDWSRFRNRRQVASYTGLCPGERSSGDRRLMGSITKHGNPRLRHYLIELAWRVIGYQPGYKPVLKWSRVLCDRDASKGARKKAVVAIARQLAVDLWRIHTGRVKPECLGLIFNN